MLASFRADVERYCGDDHGTGLQARLQRLAYLMTSYGLYALAVYRFGHWIHHARAAAGPMAVLARGLQWVDSPLRYLTRTLFGIQIDQRAEIGKGFYIGHLGGIRVGIVAIGDYCSIHQHVEIVACDAHGRGPQIGSRVWIGAHAKVQGHIEVGDGATIGSGTVVQRNVEAGSLVLGNPARVALRRFDNSRLLRVRSNAPADSPSA